MASLMVGIYEAHIEAGARTRGATRLLTFNRRDFSRLDLGDMEFVVPASSN